MGTSRAYFDRPLGSNEVVLSFESLGRPHGLEQGASIRFLRPGRGSLDHTHTLADVLSCVLASAVCEMLCMHLHGGVVRALRFVSHITLSGCSLCMAACRWGEKGRGME
ncbi:hypothetical protein CPAR01_12575 [Colletotrichum paranaense]|nr:uncharacterized protein CPAR01_12575 [Colletotrichum paranaense]KAK1528017.1 hypothetical protein CPAR01_12575 [Colletotrichum paranaense]